MALKVKNALDTNFKTTRINRWCDFTMLVNQENTTRLTAAFSQTRRWGYISSNSASGYAVLLL